MFDNKWILPFFLTLIAVATIPFQNCSEVRGFDVPISSENMTEINTVNPRFDADVSPEDQELPMDNNEGSFLLCDAKASNVVVEKIPVSFKGNIIKFETGTIGPGQVKSYSFVASKMLFPNGVRFSLVEGISEGSYNRKDFSVSRCPGVFEGLPESCLKKGRLVDRISATFEEQPNRCKINDGETYYFNMRPPIYGGNTAAVVTPWY